MTIHQQMTSIEQLRREMDVLFEQAETGMSSNEFLERSNQLKDKYEKLKNSSNRNYRIMYMAIALVALVILKNKIKLDISISIKRGI